MSPSHNLKPPAQLLDVLYGSSSSPLAFKEAERRLRAFQESAESWSLGLELALSGDARRQFFGAGTLLHKISFQWCTFTASRENVERLFGCLVESLAASRASPPFVQKKIAQALGALLVRGLPVLSDADPSPLERIASALPGSDLAALEVFGSLAEELSKLEVARDDR